MKVSDVLAKVKDKLLETVTVSKGVIVLVYIAGVLTPILL